MRQAYLAQSTQCGNLLPMKFVQLSIFPEANSNQKEHAFSSVFVNYQQLTLFWCGARKLNAIRRKIIIMQQRVQKSETWELFSNEGYQKLIILQV